MEAPDVRISAKDKRQRLFHAPVWAHGAQDQVMKRCLIVDDSSVIRQVAMRILAGPDLLVAEAATAGETIEICRDEMPDTIIVDYRLPDMDSCSLIAQLTSLDPNIKPRVLLCSSEVDAGLFTRAKRAGASGYILKPFTRAQLLESFRSGETITAAEEVF